MSDVTIKYKGTNIATMDASGTKTLQTAGKYVEADIAVEYDRPSGPQNLADMSAENLDIGYYINNSGVRTSSSANFYTIGYIPVEPGATYVLKTSQSLNYANFMEYDSSKGWIKRTLYGSSGDPAGDTTTHTVGSTTAFIRFGSNIDGSTLTLEKIQAIDWSLTKKDLPTLQTKTKSYTPSESAQSETISADTGYDGLDEVSVSVGAISTSYVGSGVTRQAAQTIHPSTTDQSIASGTYLTGAQTIKAVTLANLTAENIKEGVTVKVGDSTDDDCVASVTGTYSGGGGGVVEEKDVNFIDYDGTLLYSYTAQEASALSALPANPSHTGLTAQGWNWTLAQIKSQLTNVGGTVNVGQMYVTDDGKTRIYIHLDANASQSRRTVYVRYTQTVANGVEVDWGDGSTAETFSGTSAANRSHIYGAGGDYVITLKVLSGSVSFVGNSSNKIFGDSGISYGYRRAMIRKVELGSYVTSIGDYTFQYCYELTTVSVPSTVTSIGSYAFDSCYKLRSLVISSDATSIGRNAFYMCYELMTVSVPSTVTSIGGTNGTAFYQCYKMKQFTIPYGVTSIGGNNFMSCYALEKIALPSTVTNLYNSSFSDCRHLKTVTIASGLTSIGNNAFYNCSALESITIPSTVTTISQNAFYQCTALETVVIPTTTTVTVINSSTFSFCFALKSLVIPSTVTSINGQAFQSCYNLSEIHFKATTPPTVSNSNAFGSVPVDCIIYVPYSADHSVLAAYKSASNYPSTSNYTYMEEQP